MNEKNKKQLNKLLNTNENQRNVMIVIILLLLTTPLVLLFYEFGFFNNDATMIVVGLFALCYSVTMFEFFEQYVNLNLEIKRLKKLK